MHTVVSNTSSTFGARTWIGRGSLAEAKIAPSLPRVMTTVWQPKHKKLLIARFASLKCFIQIQSMDDTMVEFVK